MFKAALDAAITMVPRLLIADWITIFAIAKTALDSCRKSDFHNSYKNIPVKSQAFWFYTDNTVDPHKSDK